jgi:hypothetical protein
VSVPISCDVCGGEYFLTCPDRGVHLCAACIFWAGRLGAYEHPMPGRETICAHRRSDSLAVKLGAGPSVLYQTGGGADGDA